MCRLLGYAGPPLDLRTLLWAPPHSLEHQSYAPSQMLSGVVNADGWGVGWYDLADPAETRAAEPARYRTTTPMWADRSFADMAGAVRGELVLAAVRSATPPLPVDHSGTPPFRAGPFLFALNGFVARFAEGRNVDLRTRLSRRRAAAIEGTSDAEVVFALVLDHLDGGATPGTALREVHDLLLEDDDAPRTMLLSDGRQLVAARWRNSLYVHDAWCGGRAVASEPLDDDPAWSEVPDASLVTVTADATTVEPLAAPIPEEPA